MDNKHIIVERDGPAVWITLNRPEVLNALNETMLEELRSTLASLEQTESVMVAILRGAGKAFSSGRDLKDLAERVKGEQPKEDASKLLYNEQLRNAAGTHRQLWDILWRSPVVSIAQIHGYCVMGGWEIATMCDLVVAADDARIVWRPVGGAGLNNHLWPWTVGLRKTKELLFSADYVTGHEAARIGMINSSVPAADLDQEVRGLVAKIVRRPREFLYLDKKATNKAFELMGLWDAWDYSMTAHVISHLVAPSQELAQTFKDKSSKEVRETLAKRVSPYADGNNS